MIEESLDQRSKIRPQLDNECIWEKEGRLKLSIRWFISPPLPEVSLVQCIPKTKGEKNRAE